MFSGTLKTRILISFLAITLMLSVLIALLGFYVIKEDIIDREQQRVTRHLNAARTVYISEIDRIGQSFELVALESDTDILKHKLRLDYLVVLNKDDYKSCPSEIVAQCAMQQKALGGTRIISKDELKSMGPNVTEKIHIKIEFTPRAKPTTKEYLHDAMAKEYAMPLFDEDGNLVRIVYGGRITNKDYALVDRIRQLVFGNELYNKKPVGTVTIFQNDTRISTNVLDDKGKRAIGTRVSEEVYKKVIELGQTWHDRAFVVNDWYKTAYEPITDINGNIIGILYVGTLEQPFDDMAKNIMLIFLAIVGGAAALTVMLSFILAGVISKPLVELHDATHKLSGGALGYEVQTDTGIPELNELAEAFNNMSKKLNQREQSLKVSNEKLKELNKSYIDLIGFVAHELKGILASAVTNAYSLKDGFLGMVNFKQRKALDSIARNLDYLTATVKKFLRLGMIEKGELTLNKVEVALKTELFDESISSLAAMTVRKHLHIANNIAADMKVMGDVDMLMIVANNLVSNAIKYCNDNGNMTITACNVDDKVEIEVYNDSEPLSDEQISKLFQKFSRLDNEGTKKVKGTGLGLYITKEIIESHGGQIWVKPGEKGNSFIFQIERGL